MSILLGICKVCARLGIRLLADRALPARTIEGKLHILVPRWDAKLGDSIVSSFFFREIRKLDVHVTVLTVAELAQMYSQEFGVDEVIITNANPRTCELLRLVRKLTQVDAVVHLVGRIQPAEILFLRLLRPTLIYSLDDKLRCVNRKLGADIASLNVAEWYQYVLMDLGVGLVDRKYIVPLPNELPALARAPQILFNPYASRPDKCLSFARSITLLQAIADNFPTRSVGILYSPITLQDALRLERFVARKNVFVIPGLVTPKVVAGYISCAQAVVSVDTAIVHMAVGLETKLVAIFPSTGRQVNPWLPPPSPLTRVVYSQQDLDQFRHSGKKNMNAFSLEYLLDSLQELLATTQVSEQYLSLKARIVPGLGVAKGTLARQLPLITQGFPEVADCYPGTINLEFEFPIEVTQPDHRTTPLAWTPSGRTTEVFDLVRVELEFEHLFERIPAWLYVAYGSPHRLTSNLHEVIAQHINISKVCECRLHLRASAVALVSNVDQETEAIKRSLSSSQ